ncbi:MAG: GGDEF domain-containing protein, partial [Thermoanaerobaculia bacterium]
RHLVRIVRGAAAPARFDGTAESAGLRAAIEGCRAAGLPTSVTATIFDAMLAFVRQRIANGEPLDTDPLLDGTTGLPTRHLFLDRLSHAIGFAHRHNTLLAVCTIRFELAAVASHVPRVAREVADRLRHTFREIDTIARLGVDEFALIITDVPKREHAEIAIGKLTEVLADPFDTGEHAYGIPAHIGVSHYPPHGHDAQTLLEAARAAASVARPVGVFGEP